MYLAMQICTQTKEPYPELVGQVAVGGVLHADRVQSLPDVGLGRGHHVARLADLGHLGRHVGRHHRLQRDCATCTDHGPRSNDDGRSRTEPSHS